MTKLDWVMFGFVYPISGKVISELLDPTWFVAALACLIAFYCWPSTTDKRARQTTTSDIQCPAINELE